MLHSYPFLSIMLCNKWLFSAVTGIGVYNCRNDLLHGDRLGARVLTLRLLSVVCLSYCSKDSCFSTECMYFFCMQTNEQLDHQVQLYFFQTISFIVQYLLHVSVFL